MNILRCCRRIKRVPIRLSHSSAEKVPNIVHNPDTHPADVPHGPIEHPDYKYVRIDHLNRCQLRDPYPGGEDYKYRFFTRIIFPLIFGTLAISGGAKYIRSDPELKSKFNSFPVELVYLFVSFSVLLAWQVAMMHSPRPHALKLQKVLLDYFTVSCNMTPLGVVIGSPLGWLGANLSHQGFLHILSNTYLLWVMFKDMERVDATETFLLASVFCGFLMSLQGVIQAFNLMPAMGMGASGALYGLIAAHWNDTRPLADELIPPFSWMVQVVNKSVMDPMGWDPVTFQKFAFYQLVTCSLASLFFISSAYRMGFLAYMRKNWGKQQVAHLGHFGGLLAGFFATYNTPFKFGKNESEK